jgi:tetratricopeptide (TPR) repeat protein
VISLPPQLTPSELLYYERGEVFPFIDDLLQASRSKRRENRLSEAEHCALDAINASQDPGSYNSRALGLVHLADVRRDMGKIGPALADYQEAYRIFQRQPSRRQRHNQAVAAYALGIANHLLGNELDALKWYQEAESLLETAKKNWDDVNAKSQIEVCSRAQAWLRTLKEYLTAARTHPNMGNAVCICVPIIVSGDGEREFSLAELKVEQYVLERYPEIDGELFQLQPVEENQPVNLKPGTECYALEVPIEAREPLGASEGDYALVVRGKVVDREGPGVLGVLSGPEFGSFRRDEEGRIKFISFKAAVVIGSEELADDFEVGYIAGLLKRDSESSPPHPNPSVFPSPGPSTTSSPSETPAPPQPEPFAASLDSYNRLIRLVKGDKEMADRLIEYERQFDPEATLSELAQSAIARIHHDNR